MAMIAPAMRPITVAGSTSHRLPDVILNSNIATKAERLCRHQKAVKEKHGPVAGMKSGADYAYLRKPLAARKELDSDSYPYSQSVEPQIVARMGGRIYGPYTGTTFSSTCDTDIEHIVAKSEAHDSGQRTLLSWSSVSMIFSGSSSQPASSIQQTQQANNQNAQPASGDWRQGIPITTVALPAPKRKPRGLRLSIMDIQPMNAWTRVGTGLHPHAAGPRRYAPSRDGGHSHDYTQRPADAGALSHFDRWGAEGGDAA